MTAARTLQLVHITAERGFSGGEVQLFLLLEGLRKRGHRNLLVCPPGSRAEREARQRGFDCAGVRMRSDWSLGSVLALERRLREGRPDLAHLHTGRATWLGGLAAWRARLPALSTRRMDRPVRRSLRNRFLHGRAVSISVAISHAIARQLEAGGVESGRIRVVPSAVDPEALHPRRSRAEVRAELGAEQDALCVLVAAALVPRKGIDVLLQAAARLGADCPSPLVWIAGEGPERGRLERLVHQTGVAARFLGRRGDVPDLLGACDVFALPSRHEGLGVAALEAMALGRPVLASRVGGLAEAVAHEGTGLLVPPDDPSALAEGLTRLLRDPGLRDRLGAAGPARIADRHLASGMVEAYERVYAELLAEGERA